MITFTRQGVQVGVQMTPQRADVFLRAAVGHPQCDLAGKDGLPLDQKTAASSRGNGRPVYYWLALLAVKATAAPGG